MLGFADAVRVDGQNWEPLRPESSLIKELRILCRDEVGLIEPLNSAPPSSINSDMLGRVLSDSFGSLRRLGGDVGLDVFTALPNAPRDCVRSDIPFERWLISKAVGLQDR
jgi:hypothetical protein